MKVCTEEKTCFSVHLNVVTLNRGVQSHKQTLRRNFPRCSLLCTGKASTLDLSMTVLKILAISQTVTFYAIIVFSQCFC